MKTIVEALQWRYATKQFDRSRRISDADWRAVEEALVLSPSAYGLQPWRFLVVEDAVVRRALRAVSCDQAQVEECSHLVVLAGRVSIDSAYLDQFLESVATTRGVSRESLDGYRRMVADDVLAGNRGPVAEWAARQTYLALGNLLTVAALGRLDACPLEGIQPARYDEILGLAGGEYRTLVACALGYRHEADPYARRAKVRFAREVMFQRV